MTLRSCSFVLVLVVAALLGAGCQERVEVRLVPSGLAADDVMLEVRELGRPSRDLLERRARAGDIDGKNLLDDSACGGPCRALEVTLFVQNSGSEPSAPPVVRLSSPAGKPARQPIAFTANEISQGRAGRIRFLLSLWPDENVVELRPSASVFIEVQQGAATANAPDDAMRNE